MTTGYLELIVGPMYSGKSTHIINMISNLNKTNLLIIKHRSDNRYDSDCIVSHDKKKVRSIQLDKLNDIFQFDNYNKVNTILIDEGQFFDDLYLFVKQAVDIDNKTVYIAGLISDYKRQPFHNISKVLPIADNIIFKHGKCFYCDNKSIFSKRIVKCKNKILVGSDSYKPVCRSCYLNK